MGNLGMVVSDVDFFIHLMSAKMTWYAGVRITKSLALQILPFVEKIFILVESFSSWTFVKITENAINRNTENRDKIEFQILR